MHLIPFAGILSRPRSPNEPPIFTKMVELVIISVLTASIAVYINDQKQDERISALGTLITSTMIEARISHEKVMLEIKEHYQANKDAIDQLRRDLYSPNNRIPP